MCTCMGILRSIIINGSIQCAALPIALPEVVFISDSLYNFWSNSIYNLIKNSPIVDA